MTIRNIRRFRPGQDVRGLAGRLDRMRTRTQNIAQVDAGGLIANQTGAGTAIALPRLLQNDLIRDVVAVFFGLVIGNQEFAGDPAYRFKYDIKEAEFINESARGATPESAFRSGISAFNTFEAFNTQRYQSGVDTEGDDYPDGFALRPVGGAGTDNDHKVDVLTLVFEVINADNGKLAWWISEPVFHDGTCDAS